MALSTDEKAYIRDNAGDTKTKLSDAVLQAIYDDISLGNSNLNRTVFYAILRLMGLAAREFESVTSPATGMSVSRAVLTNYERLLKQWSNITGIPITRSLTASVTHVYRADSLQTEEPDYSNGTGSDGERTITISY